MAVTVLTQTDMETCRGAATQRQTDVQEHRQTEMQTYRLTEPRLRCHSLMYYHLHSPGSSITWLLGLLGAKKGVARS